MPISAFFQALRALQAGQITLDELSSEIDRQLRVERCSPDALLEVLKVQHAVHALPSAAHDTITQHLTDWPQDPTVVTRVRPDSSGASGCVGVGDILQNRFSLVAMIGEGGMSRVFKAIDLRRAEAGADLPFVAIKVLTEPFDEYFGSMAALQREAHKLQSLTHSNIVRVFDCDRDGHTVFMTMEFVAGRSLQKVMRADVARRLDKVAALRLIEAIGEALQSAHDHGIVHGDLKPGNVIVTGDGVKVIDFGMAHFIARSSMTAVEDANAADAGRLREAASAAMSRPKAITPRYASPQLAAGDDPQTADDVYSLACIAYELLIGRHPFGAEGIQREDAALVALDRPRGMPRFRYRALLRALKYGRQGRTPRVGQFLEELLANRRRTLRQRWIGAGAAAIVTAIVAWEVHRAQHAAQPPAATIEVHVAGELLRDCPTCPLMTVLPPGRFMQGGLADGPSYELPRHPVDISKAFAVSTSEVSVAEFQPFVADTRRDMAGCETYDGQWQYRSAASWLAPGFEQGPAYPVTCTSWDDATAFAEWLSRRSGHRYRLATSSEWEYAARAGHEGNASWDAAEDACRYANVADQSAAERYPGWTVFSCADRFVNTAPSGSFEANAFGLYDLFGNVFEWVDDCWVDDYAHAPDDGSAVEQPGCTEHETRGGSWFSAPEFITASYRNRFAHAYRGSSVGIRLVRDLDE